MPAISGWVARCRGGFGCNWFDCDVDDYMRANGGTFPDAITDGYFVWERQAPKWPGAAPPLRVVKNYAVMLYPTRRRVQCSDVVDVAIALDWPLESRRRR
ncbi:MAG: hypothetical protein ACRD3G_12065 [Vicinamibacterales bacterium]